ncbi:MAG: hypothetical protein GYA55_12600 [SAR324 cluster bacterium]|uniref:O-antigen ligase domain-containing protein n=1 Tax=SAR324 cluster bacterium TaxID=2024889 RepID=A0A7X9FTF5_9DELT|nr:hypothetical protein [SAR324 cluster bacterium]
MNSLRIRLGCPRLVLTAGSGSRERIFGLLVSMILLLANLSTPLSIVGRKITASEVLILVAIAVILPKLKVRFDHTLLYLVVISVPVFSMLMSLDAQESTKSLLSFLLYSLFTFVAFEFSIDNAEIRKRILDSFLLAVLILAGFAILQFVLVMIFGSHPRIIYPFGDNTWHIQTQLLIRWRANSLYYEPNIFGMVAAFGLFLGLKVGKSKTWCALVSAGILITLATTTYFLVVVAVLSQVFLSGSLHGSGKKSRAIIVIFIAALLFIFLSASLNEFLDLTKGIPVFSRINEIRTPGTSGFYRLIMPPAVALITISEHPFGIGIGMIDSYLSSPPEAALYYLQKGSSGYGVTVDNILMGWMISFGVFGFFYFLSFIYFIVVIIFRLSIGIGIGLLFFSLGTGAFLSVEFWTLLLVSLVLLAESKEWANATMNRKGGASNKGTAL